MRPESALRYALGSPQPLQAERAIRVRRMGRGRSLATVLDPSGHDVAGNWSRHDQQAGGKELHRLSGADEADQTRQTPAASPPPGRPGRASRSQLLDELLGFLDRAGRRPPACALQRSAPPTASSSEWGAGRAIRGRHHMTAASQVRAGVRTDRAAMPLAAARMRVTSGGLRPVLDSAPQYPDGSHARFAWDEALGT